MRFQEGRDASPLTGDAPLEIGKTLLSVFAAIHKAGVTHNDIKENNLIISPQGKPYVIDWDTAIKDGDADKSLNGMTRLTAPPEALQPAFYKEAVQMQRWNDLRSLFNLIDDLNEGLEELPQETQEEKEKEISEIEKVILSQYKGEIESIKNDLNTTVTKNRHINFFIKQFFEKEVAELIANEDKEIDYLLLSFFVKPDKIEDLIGNPALMEELKKELQPLEWMLVGHKLDRFNDIQRDAHLNEAVLQTHEQRVKSDSYQLGIVLRHLFAAKESYPAPYDAIIPGLLEEDPNKRMTVQEALDLNVAS